MPSPLRHAPTALAPRRPPAGPPASEGVSFGGVLGALAVAVGIGVIGAHMLDLHGHQCDRCGRRWRHFGAFNLGDEKSHTCADCGQVQWWKCGVPHVLRGSQFAQAPLEGTSPRSAGPGLAQAALGAVATPTALPGMVPLPGSRPTLAIQARRWLP